MRNLKIGAKILLGFGTVIALLVVVAVVVVNTNLAAIDNVHSIDYDSSLQTLGNKMSIAMQAARAPANRMMESTSLAYYEEFQTNEEAMRQSLAAMYTFIDDHELLEKFRPGIQEAEARFDTYAESVDEMGEINAQLITGDADAVRIGTQLSEVSGVVLSNLFDALDADILAQAGADELTRRAERIREGDAISTLVTTARMNARVLLSSGDATQIDAVLVSMDEAIAAVADYRDVAQLAMNQEAAQTILDALEPYRAGLVHFAELCARKAELSAQLPQIAAEAQTAVDDVMASIDVAMVSQIQNTETAASMTLLIVILLAGVSLLIGVVLALAIMRGITGPLKDMMGYIKQAGETGNLKFRDDEWANCDRLAKGKDEIGQTMKAFTQMMRQFVYYGEAVNRVAAQDLTVEVNTLGTEDTFGNAIVRMVTQFSDMFSDINMSATQVATGATQVADGSQALAQGATEQAASIQELSSSIAEIAERTKENAAKAEQASALADTIRMSAEKGSSQMSEMLGAVREINESSHDIGRVIQVIDSIALQTNILSLNASVEAARAGAHGKGFAVVAEEVRSLATKSAEAAKNTESLIASSMEKAELGVRIAEETSKSLSEIVSGINENSQLVLGIADSSGEQSIAVSQINIGIDQVAQVVQQNSATAEESAATAEEISAQSTVLRELIAQFKTREDAQISGSAAGRRLGVPAQETGKKITEDTQAGFGKY